MRPAAARPTCGRRFAPSSVDHSEQEGVTKGLPPPGPLDTELLHRPDSPANQDRRPSEQLRRESSGCDRADYRLPVRK